MKEEANENRIIPGRTAAFTGHRTFKMDSQPDLFDAGPLDQQEVMSKTSEAVSNLIREGYDTFLCGMAEGFDLLAARAVICARESGENVQLVAAVPFPGQAASFGVELRDLYRECMEAAAFTVTVCESYRPDCFHRRNDFLLDNSTVLVCYYNGTPGGTAYTVKGALSRGHRVINISR